MTATAERVILNVDLEADVTCGWSERGGNCSRQAEWVLRHNVCCKYSKQYCGRHRQVLIQRLETVPGVGCSFNLKLKNPPFPTWREL